MQSSWENIILRLLKNIMHMELINDVKLHLKTFAPKTHPKFICCPDCIKCKWISQKTKFFSKKLMSNIIIQNKEISMLLCSNSDVSTSFCIISRVPFNRSRFWPLCPWQISVRGCSCWAASFAFCFASLDGETYIWLGDLRFAFCGVFVCVCFVFLICHTTIHRCQM